MNGEVWLQNKKVNHTFIIFIQFEIKIGQIFLRYIQRGKIFLFLRSVFFSAFAL